MSIQPNVLTRDADDAISEMWPCGMPPARTELRLMEHGIICLIIVCPRCGGHNTFDAARHLNWCRKVSEALGYADHTWDHRCASCGYSIQTYAKEWVAFGKRYEAGDHTPWEFSTVAEGDE